jgi:hypothetical protein
MKHSYDVDYAWDHSSSERKLWIRVRHELPVAGDASEARKLEVAFEEMVPPDPALHGVRPLRLGPYSGLAHESLWEGMLVQRRVYVVGRSAVLLAAASKKDDPFPEAGLFFCSLAFGSPLAPAVNASNKPIRFIVPASFQGTLVACRNHPWLCAGYDSEEAWRRSLEAARLAETLSDVMECVRAEADEQPYEPSLLCGRFGVYCETNWALEEAKRKVQELRLAGNPKDVCQVLAEMLAEASRADDKKKVKDIIRAEKFAGCRNKQKRDSHY